MFDILSTDVLDLDELRLEHNETELPLKSFKLTSKGSLYTSVMTGAEIVLRGEHDLKGKWLKPLRYIANRQVNNGQVEIVEYELQGVVESEYDLGKDETKLVTYDRMIHFQRPYDESFSVTTVGEILELFASKHNLEVDFIKDVSNVVIDKDYWETDLSYNYRDVLNDIAEFTQTTIAIRNNKLTVFDVIDTGFEIVTAESVVFKGEYQANIVNISYEPQHDNHYAPEDVLIEGSPDYIPLEERTELLFENNPIMLKNAQQHALDVLEAVRHLKYETGEFRVAHLGVFYVGDKVLLNGKEIVITEQVYDTGNVMVDLVSDRPNGYREQYLVETDQKRQGQETSLVVDKLNGTITATVNRVDDLEDATSELSLELDQISAKVEVVSFGSILVNGTGEENTYEYWHDNPTSDPLLVFDGIMVRDYMTTYSIFEPIEDSNLLSNWKLSFFANGQTENGLFKVVPEYKYGYRIKRVSGNQEFTLEIKEYNEDREYLRKQVFEMTDQSNYLDISNIEFDNDVDLIGLNYVISDVSIENRLELAETMFGIGAPKFYTENVERIRAWAQAQFLLQRDMIDLKVEQSEFTGENMVSMINLTPSNIKIASKNIDISGLVKFSNLTDGNTTISGDNILTGKIKSQYIEFDNAKGINVELSGKITATQGKIAGFNISGNNLVGTDISLKPNELTVGDVVFKRDSDTSNALELTGAGLNIKGSSGSIAPHLKMNDVMAILSFPYGNSLREIISIQAATSGTIGSIGSSADRFNTIYLQNQPNVSSDEKDKELIQNIPQELINELYEIKPKMYQQNNQWHFGYIAQDVERALYKYLYKKHGRQASEKMKDYAFLSKSESHLSLLYGEIAVLKERQLLDRIEKLEELHGS